MPKLSLARFLVLLMCAVWVAPPAGAVGKSTVDPNTSGVKELPAQGDIAQKITYEARRKSVASILTELSKVTNVTLKAGYNGADWQVRDRKMNIFAKDVPLAELMNSIARVMKFRWSKSETDGKISYRLFIERKDLAEAERQVREEQAKFEQRKAEGCQKLVSGLLAAAEMSDSELEKLKTEWPSIYAAKLRGWVEFFSSLCAESPAAMKALQSGQPFAVSFGSLSSATKQSLVKPLELQRLSDNWTLLLNTPDENPLRAASISVHDGARIVDGGGLLNPTTELAKLSGRQSIAHREAATEEERRAVGNSSEFSEQKYIQAGRKGREWIGEPLTVHSDDPALRKKAKIDLKPCGFNESENIFDFADTLGAFSESSGFAVISDSFEPWYPLGFGKAEVESKAVLAKIESVCHYNWERHGTVLELHDRDWFRRRTLQIPEAKLEAWRNSLKKNGSLDIAELAQVAMLSPEQLETFIKDDVLRYARGLSAIPRINQDLLRLFAALGEDLQGFVFSKRGLDLDAIPVDHSYLVKAMLMRYPSAQGKKGIRLVGIHEKQGKQNRYVFSIADTDGETCGSQWSIDSPVYNPPPPPKDKPKEEKSKEPGKQTPTTTAAPKAT